MISKWINQTWRTALGQMRTHTRARAHTLGVLFLLVSCLKCVLFGANAKFFVFVLFWAPLSDSSKKVESEGGASAAKKDSKRKRELSVSDDVEVKSPLLSPPEDDDDDGVQVRARQGEAAVFFCVFF